VERWRYSDVAETATQVARELEARGLEAGDRVLLWGEDCPGWVATFWGCLLRGAAVVPMDRIAAPEFVGRVHQDVNAKLVVGSRAQARQLAGAPAIAFEQLRETVGGHSREPYPLPPASRKDTVELVFTSGTTAAPKGVVITHGNILANLEPLETEIRKYLKYERLVHPLRFLTLVPLSHVFGQFLALLVPPLLRATVVFQDTLNPTEVMRTLKRERVSVVVAVPRLLETLRDKLERDAEAEGQLDWLRGQVQAAAGEHFLKRWWRFRRIHRRLGWKLWAIVSGGAALDAGTETFWSRLGYAVIQGYGLTETTSLVSVNHPFRLSKGSIGKTLPGRELKLADDGEILVRGESVAATYWQGRELPPVAGEEGWFHTGDMGALDAQGNLFFKGRRKSVIVTPEGMNIHPEDLETALGSQPEVRDCVVVALRRNGNAEPCAVLLLRNPTDNPEAIIKRANQQLADYQRLRRWFVWPREDFPRTPTQKARTGEIQEVVEEQLGAGTGATSRAAEGGVAELLARITGRPSARVSSTARLEDDLGLGSVDRVELLSALEDRYQVDLSEGRFTAATTVGELETLLRQPPAEPPRLSFPRWTQRAVVRWLRLGVYYLLVWPATLLLGYPRVRGRENLRGLRGPVLVVSNHISMVDVGFVLAALPARLRHRLAVSVQAEELEAMRRPAPARGLLRGWLDRIDYWLAVALFNLFPLPRRSGFRQSFQYAGESVDRGYSVLVFPEGEYTPDGRLQPFRTGIGLLAGSLRLPVVPMRIDGLFELKQAGKRMAGPGAVRVSIGAPVEFEPETDAEEISRRLQECVRSLEWASPAGGRASGRGKGRG
jgi:long-chain acyl-CoA synthetase